MRTPADHYAAEEVGGMRHAEPMVPVRSNVQQYEVAEAQKRETGMKRFEFLCSLSIIGAPSGVIHIIST